MHFFVLKYPICSETKKFFPKSDFRVTEFSNFEEK